MPLKEAPTESQLDQLKQNIEHSESAVSHVKKLVQYASLNQPLDKLASMGGVEAVVAKFKAQHAPAAPVAFAGTRVKDKIQMFEDAAKPSPTPAKQPHVPFKLKDVDDPQELPMLDGFYKMRAGYDHTTQQQGKSYINHYYDELVSLGHPAGRLTQYRAMSFAATFAKVGNCGELAAIAFCYLVDNGVSPVDYMEFSNGASGYDHAWVIIGREDGDEGQLDTYGPSAVWCDPWQLRSGRTYSNDDLLSGKAQNLDANYKLNSARLVELGAPVSKLRM